MLRLLFIICLSVLTNLSNASHIVGYDMNLIHVNGTNYKFIIKIFRDKSGAQLVNSFPINLIRKADSTLLKSDFFIRTNIENVIQNPNDCPAPGSALNLELHTYESSILNLSNFNDNGGYYAISTHCCRNGFIKNLNDNANFDAVFLMEFSRLDTASLYFKNYSPEFNIAPITSYCIGKPYILNWNVTDKDGDSLSFSLIQPLTSDGLYGYKNVLLADGFNMNYNIIEGSPDLNINTLTGDVNFTPRVMGRYLVAFKVDEYRKGQKIGSIIREFQLETVYCQDQITTLVDQFSRSKNIIDTLSFTDSLNLILYIKGDTHDSVFAKIISSTDKIENLFDENTHGSMWGPYGQTLLQGQNAINLELRGLSQVVGQFVLRPKCEYIREEPYLFKIAIRDNGCPIPYYDTTNFIIYLRNQLNLKPIISIKDSSNLILKKDTILTYFIKPGETFRFESDSILKVYGVNNNKNLELKLLLDSNIKDTSAITFNNSLIPEGINASFKWQTTCNDISDKPYIIEFIAIDNSCKGEIFTSFKTQIIIKDETNLKPLYSSSSSNSFIFNENILDSIEIKVYDSLSNKNINGSRNISIEYDLSDFSIVENGAIPEISTTGNMDSVSIKIKWLPNCFNASKSEHIIKINAFDDACLKINSREEFILKVPEILNSYPSFYDNFNNQINIIDTSVNAGDVFKYCFNVKDSIARFDSIYLYISEDTDPLHDINLSNTEGISTLNSCLSWQTSCDLSSSIKNIYIVSRDNECVFKKYDTLQLRVKVLDNQYLKPYFHLSDSTIILKAGEEFELSIEASIDSNNNDVLISSIFPNNQNEMNFQQVKFGNNAKAIFYLKTDCSLSTDSIIEIIFLANNLNCINYIDTLKLFFKIDNDIPQSFDIPNVFSPNNDGINENYYIKKDLKLFCDPKFRFTIYNRWGKIVFESNDPNFSWSPDNSITPGTYFYSLTSSLYNKAGSIELIK